MDLTPYLLWLKFAHILGAFLFVGGHGVSMAMALRLRRERDPARMLAMSSVVPLWPARLSLGGAMLVVAAWAVLQVAFILGWLHVTDVQQAATGGWAIQAGLLALVGLWIAGASLLAGAWLPLGVRSLGIVTGIGLVVMGYGLIQGGYSNLWANAGGTGFQVVLPVWALLLGRVLRARVAAGTMAASEAAAA